MGRICRAPYVVQLIADLDCTLQFIVPGDEFEGIGDKQADGSYVYNGFTVPVGPAVQADQRSYVIIASKDEDLVFLFEYTKGTDAKDGVTNAPNPKHANYGFTASDLHALMNDGNSAHLTIHPPNIIPPEPDVTASASAIRYGTMVYRIVTAKTVEFGSASGQGAGANDQSLSGTLVMNTGV